MRFCETDIPGVAIVELTPVADQRGFFARSFCAREFERHGLNPCAVQCNVSYTRREGTLRGMHFQRHPYQEAKLVRCTAGGIYDVIVDLRADSPTFLRHVAVELSASNRRMLYVPEGFAHGFQALADGTEVFYQMSAAYVPDAACGLRWNDPALGIAWPLPVTVISPRDREYEDFQGPYDARLSRAMTEIR